MAETLAEEEMTLDELNREFALLVAARGLARAEVLNAADLRAQNRELVVRQSNQVPFGD